MDFSIRRCLLLATRRIIFDSSFDVRVRIAKQTLIDYCKPCNTTTMAAKPIASEVPLEEIKIADSRFLGFCFTVESTEEIKKHATILKSTHIDAAHIPIISIFGEGSDHNGDSCFGTNVKWDEDGEPQSVGPEMASELERFLKDNKISTPTKGLMVAIVRYFGNRLLGVTCGRLGGCYRSIVRKTLHRHFFTGLPFETDFGSPQKDIYGMGAGDCELILNIVEDDLPASSAIANDNESRNPTLSSLTNRILSELQFDCFKGAAGEELPRLQNLQADTTKGFIPIYRYPGNYSGDLWTTTEWSPTSLQVKQAVEERLKPLVNQTMNHCVTNYYRNGSDFIAHHGDKDLDLNREGVIVSVSLGDTRVLELRRRAQPKDIFRLTLPHRSMFVLGPHTNREWTHSILQKEDSHGIRLSLSMRDVTTFRDLTTGRLFGAGVCVKSLGEIRKQALFENAAFLATFCAIWASTTSTVEHTVRNIILGLLCMLVIGLRLLSNVIRSKNEERNARDFFSKTSSSGTKY